MLTGKSQQGLSSVEMILILPFVLILILLLANVGKFWHAKIDNQAKARTSAWRSASFGTVPCGNEADQLLKDIQSSPIPIPVGLINDLKKEANKTLLNKLGQACAGESQSGEILATMRKGSSFQGHKPELVKEFDKTPNPLIATIGYSIEEWATWGFKDRAVFDLEDTHTIDVNGMWYREDMPFGHDDYLDEKLLKGQPPNTAGLSEAEIKIRQEQAAKLEEWGNCAEEVQKAVPDANVENFCGPMPEVPQF